LLAPDREILIVSTIIALGQAIAASPAAHGDRSSQSSSGLATADPIGIRPRIPADRPLAPSQWTTRLAHVIAARARSVRPAVVLANSPSTGF
jgi:hypothetical protein